MNPRIAAILEPAARAFRARRAALALPLFGLVGALVAWRAGGGADARIAPPHAGADAVEVITADSAGVRGGEAYEAKVRLVDALGTARIDAPALGRALSSFQTYWRKVQGPWAKPAGVAAQLVSTIAFRTSADETQISVTTTDGGAWVPDARVWNMNEGSYDQREAIFAPAPATLTFALTVPPFARLRVAPALAEPAMGVTRFEIAVVDAAGASHPVSTTEIPRGEAHRWHDVDVDLSAWGGQPVDLVLRTTSDAASGVPLALWGDPLLTGKGPTRLPYDVVWIVVDALRPDVAARLHDPTDDAKKLEAARAPLETLLPVVPGLMPSIDALAARGVNFEHAWSAAAWTRPGTLAMLTGERSSELGIDTTSWVLPPGASARYYASEPPLVPLLLRRSGAVTAAFVNNFFMSGYSAVGLDMGFERLTDHRYRTRDTAAITTDALGWLDAHASDRFFLFVNYNSPHEPYDPPREMVERIPASAPIDSQVRAYMAEGAKDDAAIGELMAKLDALGLTRSTLVLVTADHGETLSSAHDAMGLGHIPVRFHHAVGNYEETTRIPIVMALPGELPAGRVVADRVRNIDIAPTVLDLEHLEVDPRMSGRSMRALASGKPEASPRVVVSEGRGSRAILWGSWRFIVHPPVPGSPAKGESGDPGSRAGASDADASDEPKFEDELYDLATDPGERHNVAHQHPDVLADLRARLNAALANTPSADAPPPDALHPDEPPAVLHVRVAGAGEVHRVSGTIRVGDGHASPGSVTVDPVGIARDVLRVQAGTGAGAKTLVDFGFTTSPDAAVGFDLRVDPPAASLAWALFLDDAPWPAARVYAGPFGLRAEAAKEGLASDEARTELYSPSLPAIDPTRDLGIFFTRDRPGDGPGSGAGGLGSPENDTGPSGEAAKEMQRMLEQWGYAHPKAPNPMASPRERE